VDWEAILAPTFGTFKASMDAWLLPGLVADESLSLQQLPLVSQVLDRPRLRIEALNTVE
jgi:hypothetical protein